MSIALPMAQPYYPSPYPIGQQVVFAQPVFIPSKAMLPNTGNAFVSIPTTGTGDTLELARTPAQNTPVLNQNNPSPSNPGVYGGIQNHGMQRYLPIGPRRDLSPQEQHAVVRGLKQWWPKIAAGYLTPIPQLLASPIKASLLSGGLGGLVSHAAHLFVKREEAALTKVNAPLALAAILGFGSFGFINRRQSNENILDLMRRLPEGATKRDLLSDPVYQVDLQRKAEARQRAFSTLFRVLLEVLLDSDESSSCRRSSVRIRSRVGGRR